MEGATATGLIRALPGAASRIPIIALIANAMAGDREAYLSVGMNDYVSKPVDLYLLLAAIARQAPGSAGHGDAATTADSDAAVIAAADASLEDLLAAFDTPSRKTDTPAARSR